MHDDVRDVEIRGIRVPALGLGTWELQGRECVTAVTDALSIGHRHVDTAEAYGNQAAVGEGLRRSDVPRDEVFVTTKVWWQNLSHDECLASAERSLRELETGWIDLLLVHWPAGDPPLEEPLGALQELKDRGRIRALGVSNFTPSLLQEALAIAPVLCDQVEYHPFLAQRELLALARRHDLMLTAYSPLARGRVLDDPTLREIGVAHGKSPAQITLRWLLQQEPVAAIPRSSSPEHRRQNFDVFDFELDGDEMDAVAALDRQLRLVDPEFAPEWGR